MFLNILFFSFIIIVGIQIFYYLLIFVRVPFAKTTQSTSKEIPISVLICAKNEAENLKQNLPYFLDQKYSNFELVLINDASSDTTLEILEQFKEEHQTNFKNIKIVNVIENEQFWGSKKYALTLGIKAATYDNLLFTDADCKPISNNWINEMATNFNKEIVIGYGKYEKIKKSFLNKLIRFETLLTAIQYLSYAKIGLPYMGVGRNLGYTKPLFFSVNGFINHMHVKSGDDDLFINETATRKNTAICISKDSFTISNPKTSFKDWILQKRRHVSTAKHYKTIHKILLSIFYVTQILFYIIGFLLIIFQYNLLIITGLILLRYLIVFLIIGFSAKKLEEKDLILLLPFLEIFLILIQMFIFIKNLFSKPVHW